MVFPYLSVLAAVRLEKRPPLLEFQTDRCVQLLETMSSTDSVASLPSFTTQCLVLTSSNTAWPVSMTLLLPYRKDPRRAS